MIVASRTTSDYWTIPATVRAVSVGSTIAGGLSTPGDVVRLKNASQDTVDAVSWGGNTMAFTQPMPPVAVGHSINRTSPTNDTNTSADWTDRDTPTPGK